jgi:hypothetical protein
LISYTLANIIVFVGKYDRLGELHLGTLFLLSIFLFTEMLQLALLEGGIPGAFIFNYYNVKLSLMVFEIGYDKTWGRVWEEDKRSDRAVFILFILSKLSKQLFYNVPESFRYDPQWRPVYESWFGLSAVVECACLAMILRKSLTTSTGAPGAQDDTNPIQVDLVPKVPNEGELV